MTVQAGDRAIPLRLTAINGEEFDIASLAGRPYMLSFFRFASCPFCNMRVHELVKRFDEFTNDFTVVAVFETGQYYERYSVQRSILGVIKGMLTRMPTAIRGMCKGYVPTTIKGNMTTMPANFLIDRDGIVRVAHYGKDEGDHLPFDDLLAFCATQDNA